jgi:2'-5' RNA ligase
MKFTSINQWLNEKGIVDHNKPIDDPKYGCVMMESKISNWEEYHTAGIDEDDVYIKPHDKSYGLEEIPHVTVVYGIHEDEIDEETISNVMEENMKPLTVTIEEVDIFEGKDYDVVKYNIPVTDQLMKYRKLFLKFPNTQSYPEYKPHMTIAYVKPGTGKKYKRKLREPFQVTFTKGVYSYHNNPDDPDDFSRKVVDLEKDIKKSKNIMEGIGFERGKRPYDALDIGKDRFKNKILDIISLYVNQLDWEGLSIEKPKKEDIIKWIDNQESYSTYEEILKDPDDILDTFIDDWISENTIKLGSKVRGQNN